MTVLILGGTGLLGNSFYKSFLKDKTKVVAHGRSIPSNINFDINDQNKLLESLKQIKPNYIINCAALTDVNLCNKDFSLAYLNNVLPNKKLIRCIKKAKIKPHLTYISTDQVYNNVSSLKPSSENKVNITNNYGKSKYYGELEIKNYSNSLIIRTNFFGQSNLSYRKSFTDWLIKNAKDEKKTLLAKNIYFNPIHISFLINYVKQMIKEKIKGTYNIGSKDCISKFEFGRLVLKKFSINNDILIPYMSSMKINRRPEGTYMSTFKIEKRFNLNLPSIKQSIGKLK